MEVAGTIVAIVFTITLIGILVAMGVALVRATQRRKDQMTVAPPPESEPRAEPSTRGIAGPEGRASMGTGAPTTHEAETSSQATDRPNQAGTSATDDDPRPPRYPSQPSA